LAAILLNGGDAKAAKEVASLFSIGKLPRKCAEGLE
jgi:hypothetical protein